MERFETKLYFFFSCWSGFFDFNVAFLEFRCISELLSDKFLNTKRPRKGVHVRKNSSWKCRSTNENSSSINILAKVERISVK